MQNTRAHYTVAQLLTLEYSPEQQAAIDAALAEAIDDGDVQYLRSNRLAQRDNQTFAVFGTEARELLTFSDAEDEHARFEYLPVVVDGQMILQSPEEGSSGMLYLMRCTKRSGKPFSGKWDTVYIGRHWLHAEELDMSEEDRNQRFTEEISSGANVFTMPPAGWA